MILVTGAAGKTGRAVIRALSERGETIRAFVHTSPQLQTMKEIGVKDVTVGDMRSPTTLEQAVKGARGIYHICPNFSPDEFSIGKNLIAAAQAAGVEHFVYHSVLHPQTETMSHHWQKLRVEEQLLASRLPFTILQPAVYMQNILAYWDSIIENGVYPIPYPVETRLSYVDLRDVAQVAAMVFTEPGHIDATYELAGTEALSQKEVVDILSRQLNRSIRIDLVPMETRQRQARSTGLGDYQIEALSEMFRYYERYGLRGNTQVLTWLLNRPPTSLASFLEWAGSERQQEAVIE